MGKQEVVAMLEGECAHVKEEIHKRKKKKRI
jgi:hypothetical protein